jgi:hypothetical protein
MKQQILSLMTATALTAVVTFPILPTEARATDATVAASAPDQASVEQMTAKWPDKVREAIRMTTQKYGPPDEVGMHAVMWHNMDFKNAQMNPIKHTHIKRETASHDFPMPHEDFLKQTINYRVPADKADELTAFDGSVTFNRTKGEMSAMCDKTEMNNLAFNLSHDVVTGKKTADEARQAYARDAMAFKNGEKPEYTQRILFDVPRDGTADPDQKMKME